MLSSRFPKWVALGGFVSLTACSSGSDEEATASLEFDASEVSGRVGEPMASLAPLEPLTLSAIDIQPVLPDGLTLGTDGVLSGTPLAVQERTTFTVSATVGGNSLQASFELAVGPELPASLGSLDAGYAATMVADDVQVPVKLAVAPDGRLFYAELGTGRVQILSAEGELQPSPFVSLAIATGGHRGLIGLALDPEFEETRYVYVMFTEPDLSLTVRRYTDADGSGTAPVDLLTGLPGGEINNGGELLFGEDGALFVAVGDNDVPDLSQDMDSSAGKVLRVDAATGAALADNPDPLSPIWASGLRNVFALAKHPQTGGLFAADNGPNEDDELNYILPGKNFAWGLEEELGASAGFTVQVWEDVITPTAITFHDGTGGWEEFAGDLFVASYNAEDIRRLELLGVAFTDLHREQSFASFLPDGQDHKPLDLEVGPDGVLWVSTFTAIYRIAPF